MTGYQGGVPGRRAKSRTAGLGLSFGAFLLWNTACLGMPQRVASLNLCTDQLAMLIAAPGQLISLSHLAADPALSLMAEKAGTIPNNHGKAEEIVRLDPDLVLAGTYSARQSVNLLKRLEYKVEQFAPASSFSAIRKNILRMGEALGREAKAEQVLAEFDARLASYQTGATADRRLLGSYGTNSYTAGKGSLENEIVKAAGFFHLGEQLGISGAAKLSLESLILADPDLVMSWNRWIEGPTRAEEILRHPALDRWFGPSRRIYSDARYWLCGTPYVLEAIPMIRQQTRKQKER